ncbi:sigma-70 family RNA polymerase sigma factor [Actinomadura sp. KC216]|uniref:sigma-70 family RNA polymerase sigma factor n=1 Tax=Actinomadura sp. KC216 TaxID=2530370 RepID=UPI0014046440|nr:sigma-70 family RNA polymerase sigma factor [Actinomadura sp. KC216]
MPDETLVKEFQAGDREAFAVLYWRYVDQVAGYVRKRRTRTPSVECEDLVQEVFTDALAELDDWRDDGRANSFRRWLFGRVAHFTLYKDGREYWVRRQAYFRCEDEFRREVRDNPGQAAPSGPVATGLGEALRGKLDTLRPHYRQVLELRHVEGLSIDQTAAVMGRSASSVNYLAAAALDELRTPKRVKHDRADKVARILAAARRVLAEHGEDGFTMRAVSEEAGVSYGLPAHYFGTRADLLAALNGDQPLPPRTLAYRPVAIGRAGGPRSAAVRCGTADGGAALALAGGAR